MRHVIRYWTGGNEPPVQSNVFHDDDLPFEIREWCDARMDRCGQEDSFRHRSNMVRWWLLASLGGLWLDHDAELHAEPPEGDWVAAVGGSACAAAVQLEVGHPLAWAMLGHIDRCLPSDLGAPAVSGRAPLTLLARKYDVVFRQIPGPGHKPTWISHRWDTSSKS